MDNIEKNGINNIDNNISSDTVNVSDGITQTAGESAVINEAEIAPGEVSEVQALPENEAMMAYSEVSSDMPSISAVSSEQPVTVPAPEPSQMDCVSPVGTVSDNKVNAVAFAPINDTVGDASMPGISAAAQTQTDFAPDNNGGGLSADSGVQLPDGDLHNLQEDGAFLAARKSTKSKKAPVVADAFSMYPDAPSIQESTGRPLTAEEARKYYATHKPVEKKPEEEQVQEEPEDTSKETPKIIIYFAILAICVIALAGCIIGLLTFKPRDNNNGGTSNGSSSVSDNANVSYGSSDGESLTSNESSEPGTQSSVSESGEQSVSEKPSESGQSSSSASSTTTTKNQSGQATQTTRRNNQTLPSSVTTKSPSPAPATSSSVNTDKPASSTNRTSSSAPVTTVKPQSSTSQTTPKPQTTTTTQTTTVKPQTTTTTTTKKPQTTTTTTTKKPQTTTTTTTKKPQPDPPTPVSKLYSVKFTANSEWSQDGNKAQGATFTVTNNSGNDIGDWTLVLKIDGLVSIELWNEEFSISGNTLTIKNLYYNSGISNGGTRNISCNIFTKNGVKIKSATLNGSPVEIIS